MTIRKRIAEMLRENLWTAREIARALAITEKEVYDHLVHVERSLGPGASIIVEPARCLKCNFLFKKRSRLTTPGRCPVCKADFISAPVYGIRQILRRRQGEGDRPD